METAFGVDFSGVRVREDRRPSALGAIALAAGEEILFAPGRYRPEAPGGRQLLAHELAHVVQQRAGRVPAGLVVDEGLEAEADHHAALAARGHRLSAPSDGASPAVASVQCAFDPQNVDWSEAVEVGAFPGGKSNTGVFWLRNGRNEVLVVKFVPDDNTRGADFADEVLRLGGVPNPGSRALDIASEGQSVLTLIEKLALQQKSSASTSLVANGEKVLALLQRKSTRQESKGAIVMRKAGGEDIDELWQPANIGTLQTTVNQPRFTDRLGRMAAADALVGNADRYAVQSHGPTVNTSNFRLGGPEDLETIDNDTFLWSVDRIRATAKMRGGGDPRQLTGAEWVDELVTASRFNYMQAGMSTDPPDLSQYFDAAKLARLRDRGKDFMQPPRSVPQLTYPPDTALDANFSAGFRSALTAVAPNLDALEARAASLKDDRIDPTTFRVRAEYLVGRGAGLTHDEAKMRAGSEVRLRDLKPPRATATFTGRVKELSTFGKAVRLLPGATSGSKSMNKSVETAKKDARQRLAAFTPTSPTGSLVDIDDLVRQVESSDASEQKQQKTVFTLSLESALLYSARAADLLRIEVDLINRLIGSTRPQDLALMARQKATWNTARSDVAAALATLEPAAAEADKNANEKDAGSVKALRQEVTWLRMWHARFCNLLASLP